MPQQDARAAAIAEARKLLQTLDTPAVAPPVAAKPPSAPAPVKAVPATHPPIQALAQQLAPGLPAEYGYKDPAYFPAQPQELSAFDSKLKQLLSTLALQGTPAKVASRGRSAAEQQAIFTQHPDQTQLDGTKKISSHQLGLGADLVFLKNGQPSWDERQPWAKLGELAKQQELIWGGDWKTPLDRPHVQLRPIATPPDKVY